MCHRTFIDAGSTTGDLFDDGDGDGGGGRSIGLIVYLNKTSTAGVGVFIGACIRPGFFFKDDELRAGIENHPISVNSGKRRFLVILFGHFLHLGDCFEHVLCDLWESIATESALEADSNDALNQKEV